MFHSFQLNIVPVFFTYQKIAQFPNFIKAPTVFDFMSATNNSLCTILPHLHTPTPFIHVYIGSCCVSVASHNGIKNKNIFQFFQCIYCNNKCPERTEKRQISISALGSCLQTLGRVEKLNVYILMISYHTLLSYITGTFLLTRVKLNAFCWVQLIIISQGLYFNKLKVSLW